MKKRSWMLALVLWQGACVAHVVSYTWTVDYRMVNYTGVPMRAMAINGQIPGPTVTAQVGDTLRVTIYNNMDEATTIHWHGVLVPNDQDGVPYLTTPPIQPKTSFTYEYTVKHAGTYWYHSHVGLQEQRGLYGALVFYPRKYVRATEHEHAVLFSDWINDEPGHVLRNLKRDGDFYSLKKNTVQSWVRVLCHGWSAITYRVKNALRRMGPMDISDIGYDAFLVNGHRRSSTYARAGERVKLRLINASAASYMNVEYAGGPMTIVAADGVDVRPVTVQRLRMAIAETYDVIVSVPQHKSYELRASSEDGVGYSSLFIGTGQRVSAPDIPKPNLFVPSSHHHGSHKKSGRFSHHDSDRHDNDCVIEYMRDYDALRSTTKTAFAPSRSWRTVNLKLTGGMKRYVWTIDNTPLSAADTITIKKGEVVQFVLNNTTMMHHPFHLHGHFFRVLNQHGAYSPLKHTVDVPAMGSVTIEFAADEDKDWFFHCHNLYHMQSGMSRVVSYQKSSRISYNPNIISNLAHDDTWYVAHDVSLLSNMLIGDWLMSNAQHGVGAEVEHSYTNQYSVELAYNRFFTKNVFLYLGGLLSREHGARKESGSGIAGVRYTLPFLLESDWRVDTHGVFRFEIGSSHQLTSRLNVAWYWNTNHEYRVQASFEFNKYVLLSGIYDSQFHAGGGIRWRF